MKRIAALLSAACVAALPLPAFAATLVGSTVTGSMTALHPRVSVLTPFPDSAIVSSLTEFTGQVRESAFGQVFGVTVDFSDRAFTFSFSGPGSNVASSDLVRFDFRSASGLFRPVGQLTRIGCSVRCPSPSDPAIFVADAGLISLTFNQIIAGDTFQLAFAAVPEPATWALMMLGFGGIGHAMRRRAKVRTAVRFA